MTYCQQWESREAFILWCKAQQRKVDLPIYYSKLIKGILRTLEISELSATQQARVLEAARRLG